jgi:hypothetical protein
VALAATDTVMNTSQGLLTETHNPLDLAIDGKGYFVTQTAAGERLTRSGGFHLDAQRTLVDLLQSRDAPKSVRVAAADALESMGGAAARDNAALIEQTKGAPSESNEGPSEGMMEEDEG